MLNQELMNEIVNLGLDASIISEHQKRIHNALTSSPPNFRVLDTCRIDNQRIIPQSWSRPDNPESKAFCGFVPAAGAASRYLAPFAELRKCFEDNDLPGVTRFLADVRTRVKLIPHDLKERMSH